MLENMREFLSFATGILGQANKFAQVWNKTARSAV